jgi:hypothetical protein
MVTPSSQIKFASLGTGAGQEVQLFAFWVGNSVVGQVLFTTKQMSLQKAPPTERSGQSVKRGVIVQFMHPRPFT